MYSASGGRGAGLPAGAARGSARGVDGRRADGAVDGRGAHGGGAVGGRGTRASGAAGGAGGAGGGRHLPVACRERHHGSLHEL